MNICYSWSGCRDVEGYCGRGIREQILALPFHTLAVHDFRHLFKVIITSPYAAKAAASLLLFHIRHSDVCGIRWYILRHHSLQW
jgi:hypothetical protein